MSFRDEDVLAVLRHVTEEGQPQLHGYCDDADRLECSHCDSYMSMVRVRLKGTKYCTTVDLDATRKKFKHKDNCPYVIAEDMLTGYH